MCRHSKIHICTMLFQSLANGKLRIVWKFKNSFNDPSLYQKILQCIFSRQASLTRQAFLITPLHGARYKTGKNAHAKRGNTTIVFPIHFHIIERSIKFCLTFHSRCDFVINCQFQVNFILI